MADAKLRELETAWKTSGSAGARQAYLKELKRQSADDVYLVYRSHYEGPLSKKVVRLRGSSVLEWFRITMLEAQELADAEAAREWTAEKVGMKIYGFSTIFSAVKEHGLQPPETWDELVSALKEHLYVEGDIEVPHEGVLSIITDDDELELAYFFFTRSWAESHPDQTTYMLHEGWRLPTTAGQGPFDPGFDVLSLNPSASGEGTVYVQFLCFDATTSLGNLGSEHAGGLLAIPGIRLPELAGYLRGAEVPTDDFGDPTWPWRLRILRACLPGPDAPNELEAALRRADGYEPESFYLRQEGPWEEVHAGLETNPPRRNGGDPEKTLLCVSDQFAQLCSHATEYAGYQQWFFYDDLWASAHPALARSLMRYGRSWDPLTD